MVGDAKWEELSAKIADKINKAEVRYFDEDHAAEALEWVRS